MLLRRCSTPVSDGQRAADPLSEPARDLTFPGHGLLLLLPVHGSLLLRTLIGGGHADTAFYHRRADSPPHNGIMYKIVLALVASQTCYLQKTLRVRIDLNIFARYNLPFPARVTSSSQAAASSSLRLIMARLLLRVGV